MMRAISWLDILCTKRLIERKENLILQATSIFCLYRIHNLDVLKKYFKTFSLSDM
jgi:hypothetical protein